MKEVIVKYSNPKTLQVLKDIAKYFDFSISSPTSEKAKKEEKFEYINDVPYIPGDRSINTAELSEIFTGKNISAKQLRTDEWQRRK